MNSTVKLIIAEKHVALYLATFEVTLVLTEYLLDSLHFDVGGESCGEGILNIASHLSVFTYAVSIAIIFPKWKSVELYYTDIIRAFLAVF